MKKIEDYIKKFWDYKLIILGIGCLFTSFVVYSSFWVDILNRYWVRPLMNKLYHNNDSACLVFIIFTIFFVIFYIISFKNTRHYSNLRILTNIISSTILLLCYFSGIWVYSQYAYSIILILSAEFILCLKLRWFYKTPNFTPSLEREDTQNISDSYSRKDVIKSTANTLKESFYENGSFVVGIKGIWGSGKTTFITLLKDEFKKINNKYLILNFEPWKSENPSTIIKSFFKLLEENLKYYIPAIRSDINHYLNYLHPLNEDSILGVINNIRYNIFEHQNPYSNINELFKNTKLPIIIFIDDIDRLNADEIIEVLKLVRNTANFPYVQFILCYDADYVINTLNNKGIKNAFKYLEKFFNVEIDLPKYEDRVISEELWKRIKLSFEMLWIEESDIMESILIKGKHVVNKYSEIESMNSPVACEVYKNICTMLPTVRDVIRFSNSFILVSNFYKDIDKNQVISGYNLLLVELLRYKFPKIYNKLKYNTSEILTIESNKYKLINLSTLYDSKYDSTNEWNCIRYIFSMFESRSLKENNIVYVSSFPNYFMYREDVKFLKQYEIIVLYDKPKDEILKQCESFYKNKYSQELFNQLNLMLQNYIKNKDTENLCKLYNLISVLLETEIVEMKEDIIKLATNHVYSMYKGIDADGIIMFSLIAEITNYNVYDKIMNIFIKIPSGFISSEEYNDYLLQWLIKDNMANNCVDLDINKTQYINKIIEFLRLERDIINKSDTLFNILSTHSEKTLLIERNKLLNIMLFYFTSYAKKVSEEGLKLYSNYKKLCSLFISEISETKIIDKATEIMINELEKYPDEALKLMIIKNINHGKSLELNPMIMLVFDNDIDKIHKFIESHQDCNNYLLVKNFWQLYTEIGNDEVRFYNNQDLDEMLNNELRLAISNWKLLKEINNYLNYSSINQFKLINYKNLLSQIKLNIPHKREINSRIDYILKKFQ